MTHAPSPGHIRPPVPQAGPYLPPPPVAPNGQPLAEYGDRALAFLIDYAILCAVALVIAVPAVIYQVTQMDDWLRLLEEPSPASADLLQVMAPLFAVYAVVIVLNLAFYYVYRVEMMFRTGQTVGKRIMKIRVTPLDPGRILTRGIAARRWLVDGLGAQLVPLLFLVDGLWQYWDEPYRQCLHDKMAGTIVVKVGR